MVDRDTAATWASWFGALGDPTRVLILNLLAKSEREMSVGEIVGELDVGQSTVSHHLKRLEEVGFVISQREGTATRCRINERCLEQFPTAAEVVLGRAPIDAGQADCAPWLLDVALPRSPGKQQEPANRSAPYPSAAVDDGRASLIGREELAAAAARGSITLVDAQAPGWFERERLPGARRALPQDLDALEDELPDGRNTELAVYCWDSSCRSSEYVANELVERGFTNVRRYKGGKRDWIAAGLPVEGAR